MTTKADTSSAKSSGQQKSAPKDAGNRATPSEAAPGNARQEAEKGRSTGMARQALEDRGADLNAQLSALEADRERHLQEARNADALIDEKKAHIEDVNHALKVLQDNA